MKQLKPIIQKNRGITLTEVMAVVAIIGILAAMAVPSFNELIKQQRVEGAAEGLVAALQNAKAEAIKTNNDMRIVFTPVAVNTDHSTWCYGMTKIGAATCDCTASTDCAAGSVIQSTDYSGITINFNNENTRAFSRLRGGALSTQGTVIFSAGNNKSLGVKLSTLGRIIICKPTGTSISSYTDSGPC